MTARTDNGKNKTGNDDNKINGHNDGKSDSKATPVVSGGG
jgi:hypothetical protein